MKRSLICVLAFLLGTVPNFGQAPNNPAAWWRLDETTGTMAADSGTNGNNGTLVGFAGSPWTAGQFNNALQFNGASSYVDISPIGPGLPIFNQRRYSVTAWVNGPPQGDRRVYSEGDATVLNALFTLGSSGTSTTVSDKFRVFIRADNGGIRLNVASTATTFDNTWHHIAWVDDSGIAQLYIDGQLDATWSYDQPTLTLSRIAVGAVLRNVAGNFFNGLIDEVRVYPFCLTSTDVDLIRLTNAPLANSFQLNQPPATLVVANACGSTASPATANIAQSTLFPLRISSTQSGYPWELVATTIPVVANFVNLSQNIVNVNFTHPSAVFLNAGFGSNFGNALGFPGFPSMGTTTTITTNLLSPPAMAQLALQFAILNPTSPDGVSVSAPAQIVVN